MTSRTSSDRDNYIHGTIPAFTRPTQASARQAYCQAEAAQMAPPASNASTR